MRKFKNSEKSYIYALIDPRCDSVRYIGKTINPQSRYNSHVSDLKNKSKRAIWINELIVNGEKPEMIILDCVNNTEWEFWEKHYISLFRSFGYNLLNQTDGGYDAVLVGKFKKSAATRRKMSLSQKKSKKYKSSLVCAKKARDIIDYHFKAGFMPARLGASDDVKEKMKMSMIFMTEKRRVNLANSNRGRVITELTRQKLRESHRNQKNENLMVPVLQFDANMNLINEYNGISVAALMVTGTSKSNPNIVKAIKFGCKRYGYYWKYKHQVQMEVDNNKAKNEMFKTNLEAQNDIIINTDKNV